MKITVNKCPDTGQLFESDREYKNHRARLRREALQAEKALMKEQEIRLQIEKLKSLLTDPEDVGTWLLNNQAELIDLYSQSTTNAWTSSKFKPGDQFKSFKTNFKYNDSVSNSHSCPRGGVTNWCATNKDRPTGYPGWDGRIDGVLFRHPKWMSYYPVTDFLCFFDIHSGTGGGGNESWGYHCKIFLDDWPSLRSYWEDMKRQQLVDEIIKGGPRASLPQATC